MKKKVIAVVALLAIVASIGSFVFFKKNKAVSTNQTASKIKQAEFKVKSAFADIDSDMIVELKDSEDNDNKYDYIFVNFTNPVADTKKEDSSNPFNIKNYTFDKAALPAGTVIASGEASQVIIKLPDKYLKGINSPHSLIISKDLKDIAGHSITGTLELSLPYSVPSSSTTSTSDKQSDSNKANNSSSSTSSKNDAKADTTKNANSSDKKSTSDAALPKYTVRTINTIPQTTIVAVTLDTPNPENYKVSVGTTVLQLKKSDKGEKSFAGSTEKEYTFDEVNKLIKIEKVK